MPSNDGALALKAEEMGVEYSQLDRLRDSVNLAMVEEGLTQATVVKQAGLGSASVLSQFLSGTYKGDNFDVARKLQAWLNLKDERVSIAAPIEFVHTSITKRIYGALRTVHLTGGVGLVFGDPGIGKSKAFEAYFEENPSTILITASPAVASPRPLMLRLMRALKSSAVGSLTDLTDAAMAALKGSERLVIVDEAQHLSNQSLELLRNLVDECGVRLVLGGNDTVWDRMHAKGGIPYMQMRSRVVVKLSLDAGRIEKRDVEVVARCHLNGRVHADPAPECIDWLFERASAIGHLRWVASHCKLALKLAAGAAVRLEHLEAARKMVEGS